MNLCFKLHGYKTLLRPLKHTDIIINDALLAITTFRTVRQEVTTVTTRAGLSSGCLASITCLDQCRGHRSLLVREAGHPSSSPEFIFGLAVDYDPRNHKTPI